MSTDGSRVFVEKRTYRRRRLVDAARVLPVIGVVLVCVPLLWIGDGAQRTPTTYTMIYFFAVWLVLVLVAAAISHHLKGGQDAAEADVETGDS